MSPWASASRESRSRSRARSRIAEVGRAHDDAQPVDQRAAATARGPKALGLAAETADIVTLAAQPTTSRAEVKRMAGNLRARAAGRDLEIGMNVFVWATRSRTGRCAGRARGRRMRCATPDTLAVLRGTPDEMAAELDRRRAELGVSYLAVSEPFAEALAPVVERLTGS